MEHVQFFLAAGYVGILTLSGNQANCNLTESLMSNTEALYLARQHLQAAEVLLERGPMFAATLARLVIEAAKQLNSCSPSEPIATEINSLLRIGHEYTNSPGISGFFSENALAELILRAKAQANLLDPDHSSRARKSNRLFVWIVGACVFAYAVGVLATYGELDPTLWILPRYHGQRIVWAEQSIGTMQLHKSSAGTQLKAAGTVYLEGIGTHAYSKITLRLDGTVKSVSGKCVVDDEAGEAASALCRIVERPGGTEIFKSPPLTRGAAGAVFDLDLIGVDEIDLIIEDVAGGVADDRVDWVDLKFAK